MKAISLTQPWATLVAIGAKRIETRSWQRSYRGPLAIHAAKGFPIEAQKLCAQDPFASALKAAGAKDYSGKLPTGCIVAVCQLVDVLPIVGAKWPTGHRCVGLDDDGIVRVWNPGLFCKVKFHCGDIQLCEHEAAFGDYAPGQFAWLLEDVVALSEPIPCRGALSLWDVPAEIVGMLYEHAKT